MHTPLRLTLSLLCLSLLLGSVLLSASAIAQTEVTDEIVQCRKLIMVGRFEECIAKTNELLERADVIASDRIAVYETQSLAYYSMGENYLSKSLDCLRRICDIGPCVVPLPRDRWPSGLRTEWFNLVSPLGALTCGSDTGETKIQTVAVWAFDNNSVAKFKEELGDMGAGLAKMFEYDFQKISNLKVVERDKLQYIIDEQKLAQGGVVDQETAIKAGRLLSAHVMIFGSFIQMSARETAVVVRAVKVETGELIATARVDGKPQYFKIEKELVKELCDELDIVLSKDDKKLIESGGTESLDATMAYAKGLRYEEIHDYGKAHHFFKLAYELDPDFSEAKTKMEVYRYLS